MSKDSGLTYCDVPLLLADPSGNCQAWLERTIAAAGRNLFSQPDDQRFYRPRSWVPGSAGPAIVNWPEPPTPKINTLWIPTGASRWGVGLFLVDGTNLQKIVDRYDATSGGTFASGDMKATLYMLPPRPISATAANPESIYLLPLVDVRYFWQFQDTGNLAVDNTTTWDDYLSTLTSLLLDHGVTTSVDADYGQPDPFECSRKYTDLAVMLDAAAQSVGLRVVYNLWSDTVNLQSSGDAASVNQDNSKQYLPSILAGGAAKSTQAGFPSTYPDNVTVVFPKSQLGIPQNDGAFYVVTKSAADMGQTATEPSGSTQTIYSTALADCTDGVSPPNNATYDPRYTALEVLATVIITDFYNWLTAAYDVCISNVHPWAPTGFDDYQWLFFGHQYADASYTSHMRIASLPPNCGISQQLSQAMNDQTSSLGKTALPPRWIVNFELKTSLTPGGHADAYMMQGDGTMAQDTDPTVKVYDVLGNLRASGRDDVGEGGNGAKGKMEWNFESQHWQIITLDCLVQTIIYGKVYSRSTNYYESHTPINGINFYLCDRDGGNVHGGILNGTILPPAGRDPALFTDDVVGLSPDLTVITDCCDDKLDTIKLWCRRDASTHAPIEIPAGWALCDGQNGTVDLRHRFIMGIDTGEGALADESGIGSFGGHRWHGLTENNHYDHAEHSHYINPPNHVTTLQSLVPGVPPTGTVEATDVWQGGAAAGWPNVSDPVLTSFPAGGENPNPPNVSAPDIFRHRGALNPDNYSVGQDTDNRPPYLVLAYIQRVA